MGKQSRKRRQMASPRASLCALGLVIQRVGVIKELERVPIPQKVVRYTPQQKVATVLVGMLAGAATVKATETTVGIDPAVQQAFGLPGAPDQSTLQETLDAATPETVAALREGAEGLFRRHSRAAARLTAGQRVLVDIDLSPLPSGEQAEGTERGYFGRERTKRGRKLLRVRTAPDQEILYEAVLPGRTASGLPVLQEAVGQMERVLGLALERRGQVVLRLDAGFGGEATQRWVLRQGYQLLGKMHSGARARRLAATVSAWQATSSSGRLVGVVPTPMDLGKPTRQYVIRTPSEEKPDGVYYTVLVTTTRLGPRAAVDTYDARAGIENDFKADKQGLGLRARRKRKWTAQEVVVLLAGLAHNLLLWTRRWLARGEPRLGNLGVVRLVGEVWAVPGRATFRQGCLTRLRLARTHPLGRRVQRGLRALLRAAPYPGVALTCTG